MKEYIKINENRALTFNQYNTYMKNLPFYGGSDFNFHSSRTNFTPSVSVKLLPLKDLSLNANRGFNEFDMKVNFIRNNFKLGDIVRGVLVNSQINSNKKKWAIGKLYKIQYDYKNEIIRVFIKSQKTLKVREIYFDTLQKGYSY